MYLTSIPLKQNLIDLYAAIFEIIRLVAWLGYQPEKAHVATDLGCQPCTFSVNRSRT